MRAFLVGVCMLAGFGGAAWAQIIQVTPYSAPTTAPPPPPKPQSPWGDVQTATPNQPLTAPSRQIGPVQLPKLGCKVTIANGKISFTVHNNTLAPMSRANVPITLCNVHQPGMPPLTSANQCGALGSFSVPPLPAHGDYSWSESFPYQPDTTPTCQAGTPQPY